MKLTHLHIFITVIWVLMVVSLVFGKGVLSLDANEIGDFLAGVAAPPAFYWLIVGYFLQQKELYLQRAELELQRKEVARLAKSNENQFQIMSDTFQLEQRKEEIQKLGELSDQIFSRIGDLRSLIQAYHQRMYSPEHDKLITWDFSNYTNEEFIAYFSEVMSDWKYRQVNTHGSLAKCLNYSDEYLSNALRIHIQKYVDFLSLGKELEVKLESEKFSLAEVDCGVVKFNLHIKELLRDLKSINNSP